MQKNHECGGEAGPTRTPCLAWRNQSEFWSDFGGDGLSVVFDVPLVSLQALGAQPAEHCLAVWVDTSARFGQ